MRVLITGATGFIGQNLIPRLSELSETTAMLLCRDVSNAMVKYKDIPQHQVQIVAAEDWDAVIQFNPDIVLHLAAFSTAANDWVSADKLLDANIVYGTHLLLALSQCPALKIFVNTGSFAEYRYGPRHIDNAYLYSATKSAYRAIVDYYARLDGYKYITAVPYSVYGGKPTVKRIMDYMMDAMDAPSPVDMTAGEQVLDFVHVDDVVEFYLSVCQQPNAFLQMEQGYEFHLGTGRGHTLREVARELENITGRSLNIHWGGRPYRERDTMYAVAPISYNSEVGLWRSHISLREGLARFVHARRCT
jgi:CDP-paratose synthetase